MANWRQWTNLKQWRRCLPHLGRTRCYHCVELISESMKGMWPCSALLCDSFVQEKKPELSVPVSPPTCLLGSISRSAFRGQRIATNQISATSGLWLQTSYQPCWAPESQLSRGEHWTQSRLFMAMSSSQAALQGTDLITSQRRKPGLRKAKNTTVGGRSLLIRRWGFESPLLCEGIKTVNYVGIAS